MEPEVLATQGLARPHRTTVATGLGSTRSQMLSRRLMLGLQLLVLASAGIILVRSLRTLSAQPESSPVAIRIGSQRTTEFDRFPKLQLSRLSERNRPKAFQSTTLPAATGQGGRVHTTAEEATREQHESDGARLDLPSTSVVRSFERGAVASRIAGLPAIVIGVGGSSPPSHAGIDLSNLSLK